MLATHGHHVHVQTLAPNDWSSNPGSNTPCVTVASLSILSVLQFSQFQGGDNNSACFIGSK